MNLNTGDIANDMLAYASQDDYYTTRNLLIKGAHEICRLRALVDQCAKTKIPPCSGHAYQQDDCPGLYHRLDDRGVGK